MTKYGTGLQINLLQNVTNVWELGTLETKKRVYTCQTDKGLGNNHVENAAVIWCTSRNSGRILKMTFNNLVTSDSSFVAKSDDENDQDVQNNCSENSAVKGDAQVEY